MGRANTRQLLIGALAALVLISLIGAWWSVTRNESLALDRGIDSAWAELDSTYNVRETSVPALVSGISSYEPAAKLRTEVSSKAQAFSHARGTANRVTAAVELERSLRTLLAFAQNDPTLSTNSAYRLFASTYSESEPRIKKTAQKYNAAVAHYLSLVGHLPGRLVVGFNDPSRPYFTP